MVELLSRGLSEEELTAEEMSLLENAALYQFNVKLNHTGKSGKDCALALSLGMCGASLGREYSYFDSMDIPKSVKNTHNLQESNEDDLEETISLLIQLYTELKYLGGLTHRYLKAVSSLGKYGNELAPLDLFHYYVKEGDIALEMRNRIKVLDEEKVFWTEMVGVTEGLTKDMNSKLHYNAEKESLDEKMKLYKDDIDQINQQWTDAKIKINPQVFARLMSTKYRDQAKKLTDTFPQSIHKQEHVRKERFENLKTMGEVVAASNGFNFFPTGSL